MNTKKIIIIFWLLIGIIPISLKAQTVYQDYYQYWNYADFLVNPVGGGGSVTVSITNNVLRVRFNAGFASSPLKIGYIKQLSTTPTLPDITLGGIGNSYGAYIQSGWLYIGGSGTTPYTGFNETYIINLSSENINYTSSENYISSLEITEKGIDTGERADVAPGIRTVKYFDGLGRLKQTVSAYGSPDLKDIITSVTYDNYGREEKQYLPFASSGNGAYKTLPTLSSNFTCYDINDRSYAFSQTIFEASPLDRVLKQRPPGYSWRDGTNKEVKIAYGTNTSSEVRNYTISSETLNLNASYYAAGTLFKTSTWDENNAQSASNSHTEEFTDKLGKVVLKRMYNGTTAHSTYYVYDDYDRLCCVIPPKATADDGSITPDELNQLCYQYKYDGRDRLIEKKIPGAGWEYLIYDNRDRLVLSQDAKLRARVSTKYHYTKYDSFNRPVEQGICTETSSYPTLRTTVKASNDYTPATRMSKILFYYDRYSPIVQYNWFQILKYEYVYADNPQSARVKGKLVAQVNRDLTTSNWLFTTYFYDKYGQLIQSSQSNPEGGYNRVSTAYNFTGQAIKQQTYHKKTLASTAITINEQFDYDHMGRPTYVRHGYNQAANTIIAQYTYDEIGRMEKKELHNGNQDIDYAYNIRGWLTQINDPTVNISDNKKFAMKLFYDTDMTGTLTGGPQYNGNINGAMWRRNNNTKKGYNFSYDGLNRLTAADYGTYNGSWAASNANDMNITTYDPNGNINGLTRKNHLGNTLDSFNYTYTGNQLASISGTLSGSYTYDNNGNLTGDGPRSLTINYLDELDLPDQYLLDANNKVDYSYDAMGNKWSKTATTAGTPTTTLYYGPFIYVGGTLSKVLTSEGYIDTQISNLYHYYLKDHLGNTRMTINYDGATVDVVQDVEYYPFGALFTDNIMGDNKYLYNGKELNNEFFENYDYGARFYDPELACWHSVDLSAEKYYSSTPYNYVANNPLLLIDPTGMDWYKYTDDDGNEHYKYQEGDKGRIQVGDNTYKNIGSSVNIKLGGDAYINAFQNLTMASYGESVDLKSKILNDRGLFLDYIKDGSDLSMQGRVELFGSHVSKAIGEDGTKVMMGIAAVTGGVIGAGELAAVLPMMGEAAMNQLALMEYNSAFVSSNLALPYNASIAAGTLLNHTHAGQWVMAGILAHAPVGMQSGLNVNQRKKVIAEWLKKSFDLRKTNKKNK